MERLSVLNDSFSFYLEETMIVLNLKTETEEQEIIKNYLEQNVSEVLAKKINNGVFITKDGKQLLNKKDLAGFWQFASKEAQKLAKQGARVKAVKDDKVFHKDETLCGFQLF